jgi:hypothetical protein
MFQPERAQAAVHGRDDVVETAAAKACSLQ